jgi:putative FmdB family regulatory protein
MPIYEYTCRKCRAHVEALQKVSDKPLSKCKKCGGKLEKEWSRSGIQFKGAGWYVTDYAGRKTDAAGEGGGAAEPKSESKAESKSESKSDAPKGEAAKPEASAAGGDGKTSGEGKKTSQAGAASKRAGKN